MNVRLTAALVGACVLLAPFAPSSDAPDAAAAAHRERCRIGPHSRVLARTPDAVVIERRPSGRVFGCFRHANRFIRLPDDGLLYTLAGPYVAYNLEYFDATDAYTYVFVQDLRRDRSSYRHVGATYTDATIAYGEARGAVTDFALKRDGSVAWISCIASDANQTRCYSPGPDAPYEVWRMDRRGHKLLDKSADIELRSLDLHGSTLTWSRAGATQSASLG
jgi:hypothetical protein